MGETLRDMILVEGDERSGTGWRGLIFLDLRS